MKHHITSIFALALLPAAPLAAQVPNLIPHQGRVAVNGTNFDGTGQFKFALVNAAGTTTYWSNNGSSTAGSQPTAAVSLPVTKGLYSVMLGDASLGNMTAVPASVYNNADLRLRVWFNDGALGFQQLTPDQRLAPNGYLPDGAITSAKLAPGATAPAVLTSGGAQNVLPNTNYIAAGSNWMDHTVYLMPETAETGDSVTITRAAAGGATVAFGNVWVPREPPRAWRSVAASADGTMLIAAAVNSLLYTSTNSGLTWTSRGQVRDWNAVAISADGTRLVAADYGGHLYTSADSGATWLPREQNRFWKTVAISADGTTLVAAADPGQLHLSTDAGVTWTPREQTREWKSVAISADGTRVIAAAEGGRIYCSTDAGETWTPREQERNWSALACSADGTIIIAGVRAGQLHVSVDSGETWTPRDQNRQWISLDSSADGSRLVAADLQGQLYTSTDSGTTWTPREQVRHWLSVATSASGTFILAADGGGHLYTYPSYSQSSLELNERATFTFGPDGWVRNSVTGQWQSAGQDIFRITGRVGIGTAIPQSALDVNGVISGNGSGLTNLNAAALTGSVPPAALTILPAANLTGSVPPQLLTSVPAASLTGSVPAPALTSVPAASLTGTINAARLPAEVALRNSANSFLGAQTIATGGGFTQPQLLLSQTGASEWSRLRMQSNGPAWDIALGPGNSPVMNFYNGTSTVLALGQNGDATLQRNLNFTTGPLRQMVNLWNGEHGMGVQAWTTYFRTIGGATPGAFVWYRGGVHDDAQYGHGGGEELMRLNAGGLTVRGTFVSSSDRNRKENIQPVNAREVLEKVAALPVSRWNYKNDPDTPHIGPMAQDFYAAFGAGADDKHIATVDADGVALAAIKGLNEKLTSELKLKDAEIAGLHAENEALEARLAKLERAMQTLTSGSASKRQTTSLQKK